MQPYTCSASIVACRIPAHYSAPHLLTVSTIDASITPKLCRHEFPLIGIVSSFRFVGIVSSFRLPAPHRVYVYRYRIEFPLIGIVSSFRLSVSYRVCVHRYRIEFPFIGIVSNSAIFNRIARARIKKRKKKIAKSLSGVFHTGSGLSPKRVGLLIHCCAQRTKSLVYERPPKHPTPKTTTADRSRD